MKVSHVLISVGIKGRGINIGRSPEQWGVPRTVGGIQDSERSP